MPLPYEMCAQLGKVPFVESGEAMKERFAGHQPEDGVAQKFEQFVIAAARRGQCRIGCARSLRLARLRAVGESLLKQFLTLEVVSQAFFQRQ